MHDFMDPELGKAIPYGVYDLSPNEGSHDALRDAASGRRRPDGARGIWR